MLLAHRGDDLIGSIRVGRVRQHMLLGIEAIGVFMAAQNVDGIAGDPHPGSWEPAGIDGLAHGGIGGACAFRAHVPLRGEPCHEIVPGREQGEDGPLRHRLFDGLQVFGTGVEKQMHVGIDQARQQSGIAEIDDFGAGRMRDRRADGSDALAVDKNFSRGHDAAGIDLEQVRCVQDDGVAGGGVGHDVPCLRGHGQHDNAADRVPGFQHSYSSSKLQSLRGTRWVLLRHLWPRYSKTTMGIIR